ncbi:MAG: SDR family oxidoreductase [Deltaproteobacteria bacterium]|nr:SDR family oxidoreductase [Deltaproteobacteria bacterium]
MSPPTAADPLSDGLQDATAVVTGGASGIGRAASELLAAAGARVFVADLKPGDSPGEFVRTDITDAGAIAQLAARVRDAAGAPAVLVNAAGWDEIRPFVESDAAFIEKILHINLMGAMLVTHAFLPGMLEAGHGKIVNVASDAGRVGSSGETAYAGAKGGIIAFTKSLAREVARAPLHVNCVCPGPTDTPLFASLPEKLRGALERAIPFRRLARPEEVAQTILFFASRRSDFITGQVLSVSGGLTMAG